MFKLLFLTIFLQINAQNYLSPEEINYFKTNKSKTIVKKIKDKVWPKVIIKTLVNSTPLNSASIFSAFDYQKKYIPNMTISKVISQPKSNEVHVYYELDMPWPVSKGIYTNGHRFSAPSKNEFKVSWYSISSDIAENLKGSAHFIPYKGKTLLIYEAHVDPKSFFAGIFKKLMVKDVEKSLVKTVEIIEKKQFDKPFLDKYTKKFQNALSGTSSY